jgi:PPOX class probable F420-dependent enzyme
MAAMLDEADLELMAAARRAVLGTIAPDGRPRIVPIAFAFAVRDEDAVLYSALDEKPKSVADPHDLARVRDIRARPRVTILVDRWDEDWGQLAWLRLEGSASLLEPTDPPSSEHSDAVGLLRERYAQYSEMALEHRPMMRIAVEQATRWSAANPPRTGG